MKPPFGIPAADWWQGLGWVLALIAVVVAPLILVAVTVLSALAALGLLAGQRRVLAGSNIGGIRETQEMLDFCAEHGLAAQVEVIGGEDINDAYDKVVASQVRYRFVIDTSTFTD